MPARCVISVKFSFQNLHFQKMFWSLFLVPRNCSDHYTKNLALFSNSITVA